ncbi:hypothetical protein OH77DRAFT_365009 [Trametes cingulata]|nr:hypothetical protein OH77DRAFT_365009 [Trametes cingulata]
MPKVSTKTSTSRTRTKKAPKHVAQHAQANGNPATQGGGAQPVDTSQWRESKVPANSKISKGEALKRYRLKGTHLADLPYEEKERVANGKIVCMHLYNERAVERKAWEHHGGPDAFDAYLKKLRDRHVAKKGKHAPFKQPTSYEPKGGGVYIIQYMPPPATYDRHVGKSPVLLRIKQQLPSWIWTSCNRALDQVDEMDYPYSAMGGGLYSRDRDREVPMKAVLTLVRSYPARPPERLPSSPTVDRLREVLAEAPKLPRCLEYEMEEVEGITATHHAFPEEVTYEWSSSYLDRVFAALIDVIEAHGGGDAGWQSIRWEVYEKYSECFGSLSYDRKQGRWYDEASQWLDGEYPVGGKDISFSVSARSKSSAGMRYNSMLPYRTPQDVRRVGW